MESKFDLRSRLTHELMSKAMSQNVVGQMGPYGNIGFRSAGTLFETCTSEQLKKVIAAMSDGIFVELTRTLTKGGVKAKARKLSRSIDFVAVKVQASDDLYEMYKELPVRAIRKQLLTEAFQKGLDDSPIFAAIAAAKSMDEIVKLRASLATLKSKQITKGR